MNNKYEFFIAGRARNKENILKICDLFDKYNISYYCFLKNEEDWGYGNSNQTPEEKQREFESLGLKSEVVLNLFNQDLDGEKSSKNLLLVLPAGKAAHIEAGIAYGLGKKCYAIGEYEATDTLYNIFESIFENENDLINYVRGIQSNSKIDSNALVEPSDMPGYDDKIIMASGSFTQGSSIELSCDGPLRSPYIAYQQGSISYKYGKLIVTRAIKHLLNNK